MPDEEWIKTFEDGRRVKFHLPRTARRTGRLSLRSAGNQVAYSVVLRNARNPLSHEDVESHFKRELPEK
jgi:hypothetical protein